MWYIFSYLHIVCGKYVFVVYTVQHVWWACVRVHVCVITLLMCRSGNRIVCVCQSSVQGPNKQAEGEYKCFWCFLLLRVLSDVIWSPPINILWNSAILIAAFCVLLSCVFCARHILIRRCSMMFSMSSPLFSFSSCTLNEPMHNGTKQDY